MEGNLSFDQYYNDRLADFLRETAERRPEPVFKSKVFVKGIGECNRLWDGKRITYEPIVKRKKS